MWRCSLCYASVLEFRSEPSQYYYSRPGFLITIPCQVVDVDPVTRRLTYVPANISVNGTTVARGQPPPQDHVLWITNEVVSGIIILRVQQEFSGWEYSCRASYNDQELESLTSTLYVGGMYVCVHYCVHVYFCIMHIKQENAKLPMF